MTKPIRRDQGVIPNLCLLPGAFMVVLLAVLLSLLMSLLISEPGSSFWYTFGLTSPFILWVTGLSAVVLCMTRDRLNTLSMPLLTVSVMLIVGLTTVLTTLLSIRLVYNVELQLENLNQWWLIGRNTLIAEILSLAWLRYLYLEQQMQSSIRAESDAQFRALQAKIQPHFFFNTLNTIASLIHIAPERAEKTIEQLADIFRASLNPKQQLISLAEEVSLSQQYLAIEQERLGDKLKVNWEVSARLADILIPPFTLQPLLENAVYHGVQRLGSGGTVEVTIVEEERKVKIRVTNPVNSSVQHSGNRMALDNIRQRLQIRYQQDAKLVTEQLSEQYRVTLELPIEQPQER